MTEALASLRTQQNCGEFHDMTTILRRAKRLSLSAAVAGQCAVALVSMTIKPQLAAAEVNFNPYGSASVESNSNVFALPGAGT